MYLDMIDTWLRLRSQEVVQESTMDEDTEESMTDEDTAEICRRRSLSRRMSLPADLPDFPRRPRLFQTPQATLQEGDGPERLGESDCRTGWPGSQLAGWLEDLGVLAGGRSVVQEVCVLATALLCYCAVTRLERMVK